MPNTLTMPRPVPAPFPLVAGALPTPAPRHLLGWLTFPAHFVLGLMLLRPIFMPDHGRWVLVAFVTALLAVRPLHVGVARLSRLRMLGSSVGMAYANTLFCAALFGDFELFMTAAVLGIPFGAVYCIPFWLLSFPLLSAALQLDGPPTFDDVDECLQLAGLHALGATAMVLLTQWLFDGEFLRFTFGQVATALLALGAIGVVAVTASRMAARERFVQRVLQGEVLGYDVVRLGDAPKPPALSRSVRNRHACAQSQVLVQVLTACADGAYRTARQHVPLARV